MTYKMSQENPLAILENYERKRTEIVKEYYMKIDQIIKEFLKTQKILEVEIENVRDEYLEKAKKAERLAEIASKFYERAQRMTNRLLN